MARPKTHPSQRFTDVLPLWELAEMTGSARYIAGSYSQAVHKVHRLNQYRKALRDIQEECPLDRFVCRAEGEEVVIVPRHSIDLTRLTTMDGRPYLEVFKGETESGPKTPPAELERLKREIAKLNAGKMMPWQDGPLDLEGKSDITENVDQRKVEDEG